MKSLKTIIKERVGDKDRWNAHPEGDVMKHIMKDRAIKKFVGRDGLYMDDDALVIGSETVMTVDDKTSVADMVAAVAKYAAANAKPGPDQAKVGNFLVTLPTELGGVLGNKATKLEKPRAVLKTDVDSAKAIQSAIKGKGVKFRMMKRKDHVAVYLDFDDGKIMQDALKKIAKIK